MVRRAILALAAVLWLATGSLRADDAADWAKANVTGLVELYRQFHRNPELSLHEEQTAARLAKAWKDAGVSVTTGVGGHGIVGIIANGAGPKLMLRTDMDALPIAEKTDLVYSSQVTVAGTDGQPTGVMHACGHDIHMTNLVGVARYLVDHKQLWSGTVMLVGQPAEEIVRGAQRMLADGLFKRFPKPDFALAVHVDSALEAGKVGYRAGYTLANVDSVDIIVRGRGGHGAAPHTAIDPIVLAAKLVLDLQTLVSRENNPLEPVVITVGTIHGGTKRNIIGDTCRLELTIRSYSAESRRKLLDGIERKAKAIATGAGAPEPLVKLLDEGTPAVYNDEKLVARLVPVFERRLGTRNVVPSERAMVGEDFSRYREAGVPSVMFSLGSIERKRLAGLKRLGPDLPSLHSAFYYPDAEETLVTGITVLSAAVLELLPPKK